MRLASRKRFRFILFVCAFFAISSQAYAVSQPSVGWGQVSEILQRIKAPEFPDRVFDITDFGAKADGKTKCTEAFKKAITA